MSSILGIDIGFGDVKIVSGTTDGIDKILKFPSVVGLVDKNELVHDSRVISFEDRNYYIGETALSLESSKIIDVTTYPNLERYSPLFLTKALSMLEVIPDTIVAGLSISQIKNSGHYKNIIENFIVNELKVKLKSINILPQGIGAKLTYDKYGDNFPKLNDGFVESQNYLIADLGFNTLDIVQVIDGKTSPNLIRGLENQGVIKIVINLLKYIKDNYGHSFGIKEGKDILDRGFYKIRGKTYKLDDLIGKLKKEYLIDLESLIENEFGKVLDKVDCLNIFGGGSYVFKTIASDFIKVPKARSEYYNAIGYYEYGKTKI